MLTQKAEAILRIKAKPNKEARFGFRPHDWRVELQQ